MSTKSSGSHAIFEWSSSGTHVSGAHENTRGRQNEKLINCPLRRTELIIVLEDNYLDEHLSISDA